MKDKGKIKGKVKIKEKERVEIVGNRGNGAVKICNRKCSIEEGQNVRVRKDVRMINVVSPNRTPISSNKTQPIH